MSDESQNGENVFLRSKWVGVDDLTIVHANHMIVQYRRDHFLLMFGQSQDPIVLAGDPVGFQELKERGQIDIKPLVRMAVPKGDMVRLFRVLEKHLRAYVPDVADEQLPLLDDDDDDDDGV